MGSKIFHFFKRRMGKKTELYQKVALLEINYELLKEQYNELNKKFQEISKTVEDFKATTHTAGNEEQPSPQQILDEWLNGAEVTHE